MAYVLVVDDYPDTLEMLAMILRRAGYQTRAASSATEALDAARVEHFDAVVSDIGMPGMNGYELAERLRAIPEYASTPLVAVTGYSIYRDRERALQAGFDGHLVKPISPGQLIALITRLLADKQHG
jgi:two-component system, chemotaxis family, CheB/CheR fusion protein